MKRSRRLFEEKDKKTFSKMERKEFLEACKNFKTHSKNFISLKELQNSLNEIKWIVETAEHLTLQETEQWFDNVTVSRHMKQLNDSYKVLEKTATELAQTQQRYQSAYEDIGGILDKYYDI